MSKRKLKVTESGLAACMDASFNDALHHVANQVPSRILEREPILQVYVATVLIGDEEGWSGGTDAELAEFMNRNASLINSILCRAFPDNSAKACG